MLLAMSMVAMVVVLMSFAVYAVISAALYSDIDNQLQSRAQLLIASGSLAADPGKAIEGTAYSDVNAMLVNPGQSIYTAQQPGQTLPVGAAEKAVIRGELFMSRRTTADQRVLAIRLTNGSSLLISKSLKPTEAVMNKLRWVLLIVGGIGVAVAAVAGDGHPGRAEAGGPPHRSGRAGGANRRPAAHPRLRQRRIGQADRGIQFNAAGAGRVTGTAGKAGYRRRT